ncbi:heavy-metal-associated domain-containing protein [Dyadobacter sp. 3J3]|uniref:heavy-metal-associated domain-containing protein n=1 Tax=Dyadobacter sp. 3J3 TaxID=2606600 RepID=UPI00135BF20C|nr:heavy-metal-associated domain-containing protein [Dyadobacter sp. 3J3]
METIKFKTNIKCGGCIAAVTPFLTTENGIEKWAVDLQSADRILSVETDKTAEEVADVVKKAGYLATEIA